MPINKTKAAVEFSRITICLLSGLTVIGATLTPNAFINEKDGSPFTTFPKLAFTASVTLSLSVSTFIYLTLSSISKRYYGNHWNYNTSMLSVLLLSFSTTLILSNIVAAMENDNITTSSITAGTALVLLGFAVGSFDFWRNAKSRVQNSTGKKLLKPPYDIIDNFLDDWGKLFCRKRRQFSENDPRHTLLAESSPEEKSGYGATDDATRLNIIVTF